MTASREPTEVLVVARFPTADEPAIARFIADQVGALLATGRVRPSLVTFENLPLHGAADLRAREEHVAEQAIADGIRDGRPWTPSGAGGPDRVPVARLAAVAGMTRADHRAAHLTAPLRALIGRVDRPAWRIVHAHVGYPQGAAAADAAASLGLPFIVTEHASYVASFLADPAVRRRYEATMTSASRVVAVSRFLAGELAAAMPAIAARIVVIPNAVAVDEFRLVEPAERRTDELLWVGARSEMKGIDTLLEAFRIVVRERPEMTLRLIGRSSPESEETTWRQHAATLGIADAVRFEPGQDRAGVARAMERATLFVHASRRETFGVVAAEALATGLPVVATDSGGVGEILAPDPEAFGALIGGREPADLAAAILRTLDRRGSFDPRAMRASIEARFGARSVAGRLADLYDDILGPDPTRDGTDDRSASSEIAPATASSRTIEVERGPFVIVAFERLALDRVLQRFPGRVTDGLRLVTVGGPVPDRADVFLAGIPEARIAALTGWGGQVSGTGGRGRVRRLVERVRARIARRSVDEAATVAGLTATIGRALAATPQDPRPVLVCLSGIDHLAAAPLFAAGIARPAPGGIRWLADIRQGGVRDTVGGDRLVSAGDPPG